MSKLQETIHAMKQQVRENSKSLTQVDFLEIVDLHFLFLQNGGAGGRWETLYVKNLIFGIYQGTDTKDKLGQQAKLSFKNLSNLNLQKLQLIYADFSAVFAEKQNWSHSDLEGCLFTDAILNESYFANTDLQAADFSRSEMKYCNFRGANLSGTDFENCDLTGSDFRETITDEKTSFLNAITKDIIKD